MSVLSFCYIYTFLTSLFCFECFANWFSWFQASKSFVSPITNRSCYRSFIHTHGVGMSFCWIWRELCSCFVQGEGGPQKHSCPTECLSFPPHAECMKSLVLQALYMYWYWKPCLIIILDFIYIHLYLQVIWKLYSDLESLFVQDVQHVCVI